MKDSPIPANPIRQESSQAYRITNNYTVIVPAYGRDYKTASAVDTDFLAGKDFKLASPGPWSGAYCSIRDFASGVKVCLRYAKQSKVYISTVP